MFLLNAVSDVHSGNPQTAFAASTVAAQVLKFFAVNERPVMSLKYAFTADESTRLPLFLVVHVLKQRLARQLTTSLHDARERRILTSIVCITPLLARK